LLASANVTLQDSGNLTTASVTDWYTVATASSTSSTSSTIAPTTSCP
jgi:hypothetical protein